MTVALWILGTIVWTLSGVIPGMIVWKHNYRRDLPGLLVPLLMVAGPFGGLAAWDNKL